MPIPESAKVSVPTINVSEEIPVFAGENWIVKLAEALGAILSGRAGGF